MGCGASKDDITEPQPVQSRGRDKLQLTGKGSLKPIQVTSGISALSISSSVINNPPSPPSVFIHSPDSLSSNEDDSDLDSSYEFPSHLSIDKVEETVSGTTALAALSGEKTRTDKGDVEERVEAILAADQVLAIEHSPECLTCPLGMLSGAAVFQALMSTVPVITQQNFAGDLTQARVGRVAVISGPEPIRCEVPSRKAEIIDLDEESDVGEKLKLEDTHETEEEQSETEEEQSETEEDQSDTEEELPEPAELAEPAEVAAEPTVPDHEQENGDNEEENGDHESASCLTEKPQQEELKLDDAVGMHKTLSGPDPRKAKLPPLTIVPPILVEFPDISFAHPFEPPVFPIIIKQDFLEVKIPAVFEGEQFEDLSARTPDVAALESANGDNHDMTMSSPVTEQCETPTPATKSPADSEWRSLHRDTPDPDIEDIVLLESQELDSLPLLPMLDCHGIRSNNKDLITPSLRLIS